MRFSIVIPNYNHGHTLARALNSVVNQGADEIILVDDCSTDNSMEVARSFNITTIRHNTKSVNYLYALEPILRQLKTDYFIGLGADDILYPNMVSTIKHNLTVCQQQPGIIFCDYDLLKEGKSLEVIQNRRFGFKEPTYLSPSDTKLRMIKSGPNRVECGVGSAIKISELHWLMDNNFHDLGPWEDSWGYTIVAIKNGCLYIPQTLAGFTVISDRPSFHQRVINNNDEMRKFRDIGNQWLKRPEISKIVDSVPFVM